MDKIYILHRLSQIITIAKRKFFRPSKIGEVMIHLMDDCVCAAGGEEPVHAYWLAATK